MTHAQSALLQTQACTMQKELDDCNTAGMDPVAKSHFFMAKAHMLLFTEHLDTASMMQARALVEGGRA